MGWKAEERMRGPNPSQEAEDANFTGTVLIL
jgi:hypothetical protein